MSFVCQSYLVQTHIHGLSSWTGAAAGVSNAASLTRGDQAPADDDISKCLLCQEYLHAGAYVMPAAFAALPPTVSAAAVVLLPAPLLFKRAISHNWTGRAPPRA